MSHQSPTVLVRPVEPDRRRWVALALLSSAQFMLVLDVTAANVALPSIGADLSMSRSGLTWVLTAYVLAFGGLMLLGGRLADALGRRRMLMVGLVVFTLSSLACGLADSSSMLIAGRVLQGVGAALVSPAALSAITTMFTGHERNRALGVWASLAGSGFVVGILVSGVLTAGPGWEWIFLVNVPVGVAVLASLPFVLPADPPRIRSGGLDVGGALLVTSSVAFLVYGLTRAGDEGWGSPATLVPLGAAALLGTAFIAVERRLSSPLIRVELLTRRPVVAGTVIMLAASALLLSMFFLASLYLQHVLGYDALETGLAFVPAAVAVTLGAHAAARVIGHVGARPVAVVAFVLAAVGAGLLTQLSADAGLWTSLVPGLVLTAMGLGPGFVVATSTALSHVDAGEAGLASGIVNTGHELGGALGVAVISTVAAGSLAVGAVGTGGFTDAFTVMAAVGAAVALAAWFLVPAGRTTTVSVGHGHAH